MRCTEYSVHITHYENGLLTCTIEGVGDEDNDRDSIAWALREIADMIEEGEGGLEGLQ